MAEAPTAAREAPQGAVAALQSPYASALLRHHAHQGASNDCGPYAAATVLNALGVACAHDALARELDRPRPRGLLGLLPLVRRVPRSATFPWGVADALAAAGLRAVWCFGTPAERLRAGLVRGEILLPYLGGFRPRPWGHVTILAAWDPARGWGLVDPAHPRAELAWLDDATFRRRWRALGRLVVVARQDGPGAPRADLPAAPQARSRAEPHAEPRPEPSAESPGAGPTPDQRS